MKEHHTARAARCREMELILWAALPTDNETQEAAALLKAEFSERIMGIAIAPFHQSWRDEQFFRAWEDYVEVLQDLAEGIEVDVTPGTMP